MKKNITRNLHQYQLYPFWDDEYKTLEYINEPFNDTHQMQIWHRQGYTNKFTGDMCDMRATQPTWNKRFIEMFANQGWKDVGTS